MGDCNLEPSTELIETLCNSYGLLNLVNEPTCLKGQPKCYNLILTTLKTDHFKTEYLNADLIKVNYSDYKKFNSILFRE